MLSEFLWGNGAGGMTMFRPMGDDAPKGLGVMLEHVREGTMKCLAGLVACFREATVAEDVSGWHSPLVWVLYFQCSKTLGIKPGLEVFGMFIHSFIHQHYSNTSLKWDPIQDAVPYEGNS